MLKLMQRRISTDGGSSEDRTQTNSENRSRGNSIGDLNLILDSNRKRPSVIMGDVVEEQPNSEVSIEGQNLGGNLKAKKPATSSSSSDSIEALESGQEEVKTHAEPAAV